MVAPVAPPQLRIAISRAMGTVVVTVHGDLDVAGARHLASVLADLIDGQGNLAVVVDLRDAGGPDPAAVGVFAAAAENATRRGGVLSLCDPPDLLYEALQRQGLGQLVRTTRNDGHRRSLSAPLGRIAAPRATSLPPRPLPSQPQGSTA
ncbi:MAG: STAS domain-containing protein [Acidimicrobiales bacterium]